MSGKLNKARPAAHALRSPARTEPAGRARRRVGITDVAREAGVSLGTVSNVLNRPEVVAETTRRRVLTVIDSLGYVRAEGARQLRGWAARVVAAMVLDLANPFFTALASGVEQAAREADLGVMVCTGARDPAEAARHMALMSAAEDLEDVFTYAEAEGVAIRTGAARTGGRPTR